jgi:hypothetical protein
VVLLLLVDILDQVNQESILEGWARGTEDQMNLGSTQLFWWYLQEEDM